MRYLGGKSRISKPISQILNIALSNVGGGRRSSNAISRREKPYQQADFVSAKFGAERERAFVSLFCGSCAIESKVIADTKILNDKHPYLIAMWQGLQQGWRPPDVVTKEDYYKVKANMDDNPALTGFVGFGCSFGGKWWGGIASNKRGDNYCSNAGNTLLRDLVGVQNSIFTCLDYKDVEIPDGAVVYADPPYVNTTGYTLGKFDTNEFWNYMRQLSKRCIVYISEEQAPDDFECVWEQELRRTLDINKANQPKKIEKLFVYKG